MGSAWTGGRLASADLRAVSDWVVLNEAAILDHWNELIDGTELTLRLRPLPPWAAASPPRREAIIDRTSPLPTSWPARRCAGRAAGARAGAHDQTNAAFP